jgi:hypothetical protein
VSDRLELFSFAELNDDSVVVRGAGGSGYVRVGKPGRPNKARQAYEKKIRKRKKAQAKKAAEKKKKKTIKKAKKPAKAKAPAKKKKK